MTPGTSVYYQSLWGHDDGVDETMARPRRRRGRDDGAAETMAWPRRVSYETTVWPRQRRDDGVVVVASASLLHRCYIILTTINASYYSPINSIYLSSLGRRRRRRLVACDAHKANNQPTRPTPLLLSPTQRDAEEDTLLVDVVDADDTSAPQHHHNFCSPSQRDTDDKQTTINPQLLPTLPTIGGGFPARKKYLWPEA
jgi:hypothetical protein